MIHGQSSELAGKTVRIKADVEHFQYPNFGGSEFVVEDWWDRIGSNSWKECDGNPACMCYGIRITETLVPVDDEVLYGKVGAFGSLVHISEIEE